MANENLWAAIRTVKSGLSGAEGLRQLRAAGMHVTTQTWYRMIGQVRASLANQITEVTLPQNRRPLGHEIQKYTHSKATGYMHYIDVFVKDKETGLVKIRPYGVRTQKLLTRSEAVRRGLSAFQDAIDSDPGQYPETVLGAVHTGAYQFVPDA